MCKMTSQGSSCQLGGPREWEIQTYQTHIQVPMLESSMGFGFFVLFCFSLDTNFLTMCPLKPVAQNGFRGASDAPRKGGRPSPLRRNSGAQPLRPREHTARWKSSGGSDRPRIRQAPTPPRPTPTVPAPHTGLHAAPQPSPAQHRAPRPPPGT